MQPETIGKGELCFKIDYTDKLGSGAFGDVFGCYRVADPLKTKLAIKIVKFGPVDVTDIMRELDLAQKIIGKYICQVYFAGKTQTTLYIVTEFCEQGTLKQYYLKFKPNMKRCLEIFQQVCQGYYESLYKKNVIHRDLKPDNILMSNDLPKIADFGLGKSLDNNKTPIEQTYKCSPAFGAPQILVDKCIYSYKCDIYSLGVILYQLLNDLKTINEIQNMFKLYAFLNQTKETPIEELIIFYNPDITESIKKLIYSTLRYKEEDRISIEALLEELKKIIIELSPSQQQTGTPSIGFGGNGFAKFQMKQSQDPGLVSSGGSSSTGLGNSDKNNANQNAAEQAYCKITDNQSPENPRSQAQVPLQNKPQEQPLPRNSFPSQQQQQIPKMSQTPQNQQQQQQQLSSLGNYPQQQQQQPQTFQNGFGPQTNQQQGQNYQQQFNNPQQFPNFQTFQQQFPQNVNQQQQFPPKQQNTAAFGQPQQPFQQTPQQPPFQQTPQQPQFQQTPQQPPFQQTPQQPPFQQTPQQQPFQQNPQQQPFQQNPQQQQFQQTPQQQPFQQNPQQQMPTFQYQNSPQFQYQQAGGGQQRQNVGPQQQQQQQNPQQQYQQQQAQFFQQQPQQQYQFPQQQQQQQQQPQFQYQAQTQPLPQLQPQKPWNFSYGQNNKQN